MLPATIPANSYNYPGKEKGKDEIRLSLHFYIPFYKAQVPPLFTLIQTDSDFPHFRPFLSMA